jgi:branched-chain amino acid transport system substrate-binding protein
MRMKLKAYVACTLVAVAASAALAQTKQGKAEATAAARVESRGISRTEITLGTIQDLSGPIAGFGKHARQGMLMRVNEQNEFGGVHGRKIKLLIEDHSYDPKKAVLAAQKLVNQEKIFAMVGNMGSAQNIATFPILFDKNVINFHPLAAAREMYEPHHRLKVAFLPTYYDQMRIAAPRMMKDHNLKKACIIYQDDEYGLEILRGAEAGLKAINTELTEKTSYKRGATDFSSQVARMKAAGCDLVLLGTIIRETVGTIGEARKTGYNPTFVAVAGAYTDLIPRLGGKAMDGLYATMLGQIPYADESSIQQVRFWANKYKTQFNEDPTEFAVYGYHLVDAFIRVAQKAGPDLNTESFLRALETIVIPRDQFGMAEETYGPTKRLGTRYSRLSKLQDGRWKVVSDYVTFNGLKFEMQNDGRMKVLSEAFKETP